MKRHYPLTVTGAAFAVLVALTPVTTLHAQEAESLERRVQLLERKLSSNVMTQMANDLRQLRQAVSELRGRVDVLEQRLSGLQERQRQIYADVDSRLRALEENGAGGGGPSAGGTGDTGAPTDATGQTPANDTAAGSGPDAPTGGTPQSTDREAAPEEPATNDAASAAESRAEDPAVVYQTAFDTLQSGAYDEAASQFKAFLDAYPDSSLADNARYWLGESYYVVREFDEAMKHFRLTREDYPDSSKGADALLKIGYIHYEQGRLDASRETLREVVETYPDSQVAGYARKRLERM